MHLLPENIVNLAAANTQQVDLPLLKHHAVALHTLRLDKIDPLISGNKWFKLKYYLQGALAQKQKTLLSFGGAWSNHLVAVAAAANKCELQSIGLVRGGQPAVLPAALNDARALGMQLVFLSRETYRKKADPLFVEALLQEYGNACIIPEGGAGEKGVLGAAEILRLADLEHYTHLVCAIGTGTMLAGLMNSSLPTQQIIGIPVLKSFNSWTPPISIHQQPAQIFAGYHMGGYARETQVLFDFMNKFYEETGIPTDFVYTGKLFYSIFDLIKKEYFPKKSRLLAIHSGGLQGNRSLSPKTLVF